MLKAQPSVSNFGHNRPRPFTVYGASDARDQLAEEQLRKNMTRRSGEIWVENGHAIIGGNRWSRTAEMLKPVPAMRALDTCSPSEGVIKKFRGGVVSMLPKRVSEVRDSYRMDTFNLQTATSRRSAAIEAEVEAVDEEPTSPVTIQIVSPSKSERDRRASMSSTSITHDGEADEGLTTIRNAEIQVATRGRMSMGPVFLCRPTSVSAERKESFDIDWMTAGVLPR